MRNGSPIEQAPQAAAQTCRFTGYRVERAKRNTGRISMLSAAVLAAACSGPGANSSSSRVSEPRLSIAYSALTAKVGDTISLTAHLENATGEVAWSMSGPGALSATSGEEVLFEATAEGTAGVVASADGLTSSVEINVLGGPGGGSAEEDKGGDLEPKCLQFDVKGLILNEDGNPIESQGVFILNNPSTLTSSDAQGHFVIKNVTEPYDLAMIEGGLNRVFVYRGLTRPDPTLYVFTQMDRTRLTPRFAELKGVLHGGDGTQPLTNDRGYIGFASKAVQMALDPDGQNWTTAMTALPDPGAYGLKLSWNGPETTTGTLVALEVRLDQNTGAPFEYWYAYQPQVTLLSGQPSPLVGPNLMLLPVAGANTQGTINLPSQYVLLRKYLGLSLEKDVYFFPVFTDLVSLEQPNFKYFVPRIQNGTTQVCVQATDMAPAFAGSYSNTCIDALEAQSSDAHVEILAAPQPFAPANGANLVGVGSTLAWSPFKGGIHFVQITPSDVPTTNPSYFIFTAGTSTTIPDLGAAGLGLGDGTYRWTVAGFAPFASVDEFTEGIPAPALSFNVSVAPMLALPVPNASSGVGVTYSFTHTR
jgi:hypothetical protein